VYILDNFFEEQALRLMKKMNQEDFMKVLVVEVQRCFQNMSNHEKNMFDKLFNQLFNQTKQVSTPPISSYFVENFYKATVGRNVSIIGKKIIIEGKIKNVDDEKKVFEMVIKKSNNKTKVGSKLKVCEDMFHGDLQLCVFE
jgi:hypothetical protein